MQPRMTAKSSTMARFNVLQRSPASMVRPMYGLNISTARSVIITYAAAGARSFGKASTKSSGMTKLLMRTPQQKHDHAATSRQRAAPLLPAPAAASLCCSTSGAAADAPPPPSCERSEPARNAVLSPPSSSSTLALPPAADALIPAGPSESNQRAARARARALFTTAARARGCGGTTTTIYARDGGRERRRVTNAGTHRRYRRL